MNKLNTNNLYESSWELYKAHSEGFSDDIEWYINFCRGHKTLELFAGYGRLSNILIKNDVDLSVVELEPNLAKYIEINDAYKHITDVLTHETDEKYSRIIAGFDSFALLTSNTHIRNFFLKIESWLTLGGRASLSYYHFHHWADAKGYLFTYKDEMIQYIPSYDLSNKNKKIGVWEDAYKYKDNYLKYEYPVRLYETPFELQNFIDGTSLIIEDVVYEYNNPNIKSKGWVEYIIKREN